MACVVTLPALSFDPACPTVKPGQVYRLYQTRATSEDVLDDVEDLVEWTARLSQSSAIPGSGAAPIRTWTGIGSWAASESSQVDLPLGQVHSQPGNKVLTFKVYDLSTANMTAAISIRDKGSVAAKVWTEQGDTILGGDSGIDGMMTADIIVPEGRAELQYIELVFTTKKSLNSSVASPLPDPFV